MPHIVDGESTQDLLRWAGVPGTLTSWGDSFGDSTEGLVRRVGLPGTLSSWGIPCGDNTEGLLRRAGSQERLLLG